MPNVYKPKRTCKSSLLQCKVIYVNKLYIYIMHLQGNLPCFDKKGQQAVTKLFSHLQDANNHMAEVAKAIVNVSEVSSPEQFTFVLQLAVRPIVQLKISPHLSAPTELKFERERLTPEELTEENCCNLILP